MEGPAREQWARDDLDYGAQGSKQDSVGGRSGKTSGGFASSLNRVDPIFFSSDEEDASSPARKRSEPLTAFEAEEEVRRSSQRDWTRSLLR